MKVQHVKFFLLFCFVATTGVNKDANTRCEIVFITAIFKNIGEP